MTRIAEDGMVRDALLSDDGLYRYRLDRKWAPASTAFPLIFVMLNPSIADALIDDPTIRRCIGFAKREGFDALTVLNLYAMRSTKPDALWLFEYDERVGPINDRFLLSFLRGAASNGAPVVCGWGVNAEEVRVDDFLELAFIAEADLRCLGKTKNGSPKHPLYLPGVAPLVSWP